MHLDFYRVKDHLVIKLFGELDHHNAMEVRTKIDDKIDREKIYKVIIDFRDVSFMDSSGIGVLINRYKKVIEQGGELYIVNTNERVDKIFTVSGIYKIINKIDSIESIVSNF